jgi:hypothetical protein
MKINKDGNWRMYTNTIPAGSTALGTITRDEVDTGALVRIESTGAYVQVNAGAMRNLDRRAVAMALGLIGRPPIAPELKATNLKPPRSIRLDDERWEKLKALGTDWLERAIDRAK